MPWPARRAFSEILGSMTGFCRALARTRTVDPFLTMEVLYQLSYEGVCRDFLNSRLPGLAFRLRGGCKSRLAAAAGKPSRRSRRVTGLPVTIPITALTPPAAVDAAYRLEQASGRGLAPLPRARGPHLRGPRSRTSSCAPAARHWFRTDWRLPVGPHRRGCAARSSRVGASTGSRRGDVAVLVRHSSATLRTAGVKYLPGHLWAWLPVMWPSGAP
jgi:hypothetical protein